MLARRQPRTWFRHAASGRAAITLPEVLTVFGVIALLLALLVPSLSASRERARRLICANNLRQWGVASQCYRDENHDYLPTEGTYLNPDKPYTWFNVLPPYLDAPAYRDIERYVNAEGGKKQIKEFPELHIWICPSKNLSPSYKSFSGKNQFHYGMNEVLDGVGKEETSDFPDRGELPIRATPFAKQPRTVFMFDIYPNSPRGKQGDVATKFHGNYANVLYLNGGVARFCAEDFVVDGDFRRKDLIWRHPQLYWGYIPSED